MIIPTPFRARYGAGGQYLRVPQGYAPMSVPSALRYSQGNVPGNPGVPTGLGGIYGMGTGLYGVPGVSGLNFDGTGLFGTGLFGASGWGLGEWVTLGLGALLAWRLIGGGGFIGGRAGRRHKLAVIRDKYQLERDTA